MSMQSMTEGLIEQGRVEGLQAARIDQALAAKSVAEALQGAPPA